MLKGLINIMETSWKKIILRFCIIVIIIFSASYVVGEYREYKEQQEIGTQLEREEVSTEVRNEVLTGKAGVKDKLLGYEDVNLTRLYIYVHAYNQMVEEDERIIIDDVNSNKENEIGNIDGLSKEFLYSSFSDNYDIKEYMNAKLPFDYFEEDRETTHHIDAIETFIYRVASGRLNYEEKVKDYEYQIRLLANEYMAENPEIKCELNEYGNVEIYDLSIEQVNELIRKYDLKELKDMIGFGGSPRASINLALAARTYAFIKRRGYVIPEDVRAVAHDVLRHRIGLTYEAEANSMTSDEIISKILNKVEVP